MDRERKSRDQARLRDRRRLVWAFGITLLFFLVEVIGGLVSGSLGLLADAAHMLSDVGALGLALLAWVIAQKPADKQRTYGYSRSEVLVALINGITLLGLSVFIFIESVKRFLEPRGVQGEIMAGVALAGLLANLLVLKVLHRGRQKKETENLNIQGAFLHVLGDTLSSVGVLIGGILLTLNPKWMFIDPILSFAIALLVFVSAFHLLKQCLNVLLEGVPPHIDVAKVEQALVNLEPVQKVHDLHIWTLTSGFQAMSVHLVVDDREQREDLLGDVQRKMATEFEITHCTVQIESLAQRDCAPCSASLDHP